jgi:hypothetical protein
MRLFHGTPNLQRALADGFIRPSSQPEPLPDLASTLSAYRKVIRKLKPYRESGEPWKDVNPEGKTNVEYLYSNWYEAAITPMRGFAYVTTDRKTAERYAKDAFRGTQPGVVEVETAPGAAVLPDEDWMGCIAAYNLSTCSEGLEPCNMAPRGDAKEFYPWAAQLPKLVSQTQQAEIKAAELFIKHEIDWDGYCTIPMQAVLGRTVIRDLFRPGPNRKQRLAWLIEGLKYTDSFAHHGSLRILGTV